MFKKILILGLMFCSFQVSAQTVTKGVIGKQDIHNWDGKTQTFTRLSSTGYPITLSDIDWIGVDVCQVYGGGVNRTSTALSAAITAIGSTEKTELYLSKGVWTVTGNVSIPANYILHFAPGAYLNGTFTLAFAGSPDSQIKALPGQQIFGEDLTVTFGLGGEGVYINWWGVDLTGVTDCSTAWQKAINSLINSYNSPRRIKLTSGKYLIRTPLNYTGIANAYIETVGQGNSTYVYADTGGRLFDCVGVNYLTFEDFYIVRGPNTPSTIGFLLARGATTNFSHYHRFKNIKMELSSIHTANNSNGTIGILGIESENLSIADCHIGANLPIAFDRAGTSKFGTITSYQTLSTTSVSFGSIHFSGHCMLQAWNKHNVPLYINGVNTLDLGSTYMVGGTSPWDSDTVGSNEYAIEVGSLNAYNITHNGLIEGHDSYINMGGSVISWNAHVYLADHSSTSDIINLSTKTIYISKISVINGNSARNNLVTDTAGTIASSEIRGYNIATSLGSNITKTAVRYIYESVELFYGSETFSSVVTAASFRTSSGSTASTPTATPVTLFTPPSSVGMYIIFTDISGGGSAAYGAHAVIVTDGTNARIIADNANNLILTLSGYAVQATQTSGGNQVINYRYVKIY